MDQGKELFDGLTAEGLRKVAEQARLRLKTAAMLAYGEDEITQKQIRGDLPATTHPFSTLYN